jgi:NADH dehydrogenase FAD-containing subunit
VPEAPLETNRSQDPSASGRTGVAMVFGLRFSGFVAWWLWRTVYLMKLPRLTKKLRVLG